ncbi:unnamed protein product (macronuclear) [Paramecium tetraurelia]|uniref:Potassium channel domain-containing protein n=1 Tax=Paramecium tetraurelia TaxID=5888 RepID=A0BX91_PARTE|nr:uncharacterized protein GSPATT00033011001 [Paramecium tetraurelia]CAK63158.1 unnamed protein product [Paramecium tetraurelia]|eukprot:XP_001430556.1 hypothetical protein (macronuclear) [Paramecium tetraurelia strain d4-2]
MLNLQSGFDFEQDVELRAVQNEDFEQQYLGQCLRETKKEFSLVLPQIASRTLSAKSLEAKYLHSPKSPDSNNDENILASNIQTPKEPVFHGRQVERRRSQANAESSFMSLFYIGRFVEKLSKSRKQLGSLNDAHFNLIGDKASDSQTLFMHSKRMKSAGFNIKKMQTLLKKETDIKDTTIVEQVKEDLKKLRKPLFNCLHAIITKIPIIQPESLFKMYWDFFTSIFRILLLILVPLEIAFKPEILFNNLIQITYVILVILQLDFLIRVNTLTYKNGYAIKDKWDLVVHQLKKEFLTDFSTSLILIIFMIIPDMNTSANLFLLVILGQHKYVYETFAKSDQISYLTRPQRGVFSLLKFILTLLYILHLFSCIWFYFSSIRVEDSWIRFNDIEDKSWEEQYLQALYFAVVTMLTIGYGDMVPKNAIEKIVTMVFVLGACLWVSYSVNFIGSIIDDITQNQVERNRRMRVINKYMNQRKIPYSLQHQVKEYLTFRWKEDDEVDLEMEQTLLEQLSDELKEELDKQAHKVFIQKSDFLQKYFSEELRNALFKSIKRKIVPPQNTFSTDFSNEQHLCFVEQGFIVYQHPERKQRSKMNAVINQGQFFCVNDFITNNPQVDHFKAIGYVSLLILSKSDFMETLKDYPEDFQKYCQLKEGITLSCHPPALENGVFCPACLSFKHSLNTCPQVQYVPNREAVIKRYCMSNFQNSSQYTRKQDKEKQQWHTRLMKDLAQQYASVFQNENQQIIMNHTRILLNFECGSDSNSSLDDDAGSPAFKLPQTAPIFQAQHIRSSRVNRLISDQNNNTPLQKQTIMNDQQHQMKTDQQNNVNELRQNLNNALQNRKQSILAGAFGMSKSPRNRKDRPIPLVDEIKEFESGFQNISSDDNEMNTSIDFKKKREEIAEAIQDFNNNMLDNITNLYHQLQRNLELNENDNISKKALLQLEPNYWSFNQQKFDDFEIKASFESYYNKQNVEDVILYVKYDIFEWQTRILQRMRKFMLYPFLYIQNFLRLKRNDKVKSITPMKKAGRVENALKNLKETLKLKRKTTFIRSSNKIHSVVPEFVNPFQQYKK